MSAKPVDEILNNLQACFCAILAETVGGAPADCCVTAGQPIIADCCAGFAWIRLVRSYQTHAFPAHANVPTNCMLDQWAIVVEIGVARCAPASCDSIGNVCCEAQATANDILLSDFHAMRKLFSCGCTGISAKEIVTGDWAPVGPEGGCLASKMTATILSSGNCDCQETP